MPGSEGYVPDEEERALHERRCNQLMRKEGLKGAGYFLAGGIALSAVLHVTAKPNSVLRLWQVKGWIVAASIAAGYSICSERAGIKCARNPPWMKGVTSNFARKPAA